MSYKGRVLVAMSGGVDSSVAASLLVEQGYEVIGATMQVWDYTQNNKQKGKGTCCSSQDVEDARAVCDVLGIPFYVLNCEDKFQAYVIDDFLDSYLSGRTPLPCINCNTYLKFDHLIKKMKALSCDYLATGHYAQVAPHTQTGRPAVFTSFDDWKDQTYFLFTLKPELLPYLMFPVGTWEKPRLRDYAQRKGLPVAQKKDSTGLCFIGREGYAAFIEKHKSQRTILKGDLLLYPEGKLLGVHEGIHLFTYGQRKGLGVHSQNPLYVVKIDRTTGDVWLGEEKHLYSRQFYLKKVNLLDDLKKGQRVKVKIRFHHPGAIAQVKEKNSSHWLLEFDDPQRAITPGQAAVMYRENQLLGGGWVR